jgi:hypothetical protein
MNKNGGNMNGILMGLRTYRELMGLRINGIFLGF